MSTIKSSSEHLTLNADGSGNDVIIQSDGSTKAIVTAEGDVGIGTTTPAQKLSLNTGYVQVGNGIGGAGGVKYPYSAANADCRNWRTRSDMVAYGDWGIEQSTTQSGETYSNKLRVSQAGDVIVGTGDLIFETANKGIVLGATTNVDANTLDDYEVGSGTPVAKQGSTTITLAAGATQHYVKVGSLVTFLFEFQISNLNSGSGNYTLDLPFTMMSSGYATSSVRIYNGEVVGNEFIAILSGDSKLHFKRNRNGTSTDSINPTVAGYYFGSISYRTAS